MSSADRTLIVEARDLDTDERTIATFEVAMPADEAGQRAQIAGAVAQLHPDARIRSFGDGAASFLDSRQLVVAHYRTIRPPLDVARTPPERAVQQPLFAADAL